MSDAYVSVLVGSDGYKLGLWKGEALRLHVTADVLHSGLCHLHDVQPGLVLVQRLQDNHLHSENHMFSAISFFLYNQLSDFLMS